MAKSTKKKKKVISPEEKARIEHSSMVRTVFRYAGFTRIPTLADKAFTYLGQQTDFDEVYVFENVLVCVEITSTATANLSGHLKPKKIVYDKIQADPSAFVAFYAGLSAELTDTLLNKYAAGDVVVRIVYASRNAIEGQLKENVPNPIYLDYPVLRYFRSTADTIRRTARHEVLEFLGVGDEHLGSDGAVGGDHPANTYIGSLLPENASNFDDGYKVVSFYIDPASLLERAYVLRRDGWRSSHSLYQRLLSKEKIDAIRRYLKGQKRVFVNNLIATLPPETKVLDGNNNQVDPAKITNTKQVKIMLPRQHNSVGLVDGQHRTYAYYEAADDDIDISKMRKRQNLLMTGVIYPEGTTRAEREKFEARLFLEINANQTTAKSNLKQAIGLILDPFAGDSIAARVLDVLDRGSGPLSTHVERYFFDTDKLKPTSIVSYGLKPLVKLSGSDSLFAKWDHADKALLLGDGKSVELLETYVAFCAAEINALLVGFKVGLGSTRWTTDKAVTGRVLTTTWVNAMLIVLRLLIEGGNTGTQAHYTKKLGAVGGFDASGFHSSQYRSMAEAIVAQYFS